MTYLVITILIYIISKKLYQKWKHPLLTPLFVSPTVLIIMLLVLNIPFEQYKQGTDVISYFLGPATVAFAIPIYKHYALIKKFIVEIITSITAGSIFAILSSFFLGYFIHLSGTLMTSILPRSITTPIAIEVSEAIGGVPALTAAFVVCTGIIGSIVGPYVIRFSSIQSPIARGLSFGMAAHGAGTSKAFEFGDQEGTFSSLAMIIAAGITLLWGNTWVPSFQHLFM
ncbi:CidB/LrgB family autolysis modulator [Pontibacillus yanchengensis]|uniref:CidB/LrgB family autolysis modulator n=2 Tax=Pontibacillus yanchengensis TaxID=462910 RepID=A0ACC7VDV2_9BACI|nr:LrgB family protein [Pontibacillus yanchengensis]MYL34700.1 CidB/LrgB family autolysis modulator [Pontibacillus yanchengensis]MYL52315.1 CidB/LrgB family autolysis modulator [Pontibacillus yanchengensis]